MNLEKFIDLNLYFIIYGFLGWIVEVVYISIRTHKLQNRGFLYGPFLPIYAFGAIFIILFLSPFKYSLILVFLFGVLLTTILEYISAYFLETTFHVKWWDYSSYKYNYRGRICLRNSILFGLLTVLVIFGVQPFIINITKELSLSTKTLINDIFFIAIIVDLYFTLKKLNKLPVRHIELLNTRVKDLDIAMHNSRLATLNQKFKNNATLQEFNILLIISVLIGLLAIFIFNIYVGLFLTLILFLSLYVFKEKKQRNNIFKGSYMVKRLIEWGIVIIAIILFFSFFVPVNDSIILIEEFMIIIFPIIIIFFIRELYLKHLDYLDVIVLIIYFITIATSILYYVDYSVEGILFNYDPYLGRAGTHVITRTKGDLTISRDEMEMGVFIEDNSTNIAYWDTDECYSHEDDIDYSSSDCSNMYNELINNMSKKQKKILEAASSNKADEKFNLD